MNFYKRFIGDYLRDTSHLTMLEHGAFGLLLDAFYAGDRPLPADKKALYRIVRSATPQDNKAVDAVLLAFFKPLPEDWEGLRNLLKVETDEQQRLLREVAKPTWFDEGGYINQRAIFEMMDYQKRAAINRKIALEREKVKREKAGAPAGQGVGR